MNTGLHLKPSSSIGLPEADLDYILEKTSHLWGEAKNGRFFLTGGSGFFGGWLLESFLTINNALGLGANISVLTRDAGRFIKTSPHLAKASNMELLEGDIKNLGCSGRHFDFALHVATETRLDLAPIDPSLLLESNLEGTRRFLDIVRGSGVRKFLFTSSGAVYGTQPTSVPYLSEDMLFAPDVTTPAAAYGESKRVSEFLCAMAGSGAAGAEGKIARCFAFVGPRLPLHANYAIGNFIRDALRGSSIAIGGDGTPRRSYLYSAELTIWLWTILFRGRPGQAYNVGSSEDRSILQVAETVRSVVAPQSQVHVAIKPRDGALPSRYVPDVSKASTELGLRQAIGLEESIRRTAAWYSCMGNF